MEKTIKYLENGEYHYATVKDVGDLAKLKTDSKDDLVTALNELYLTGGEGGNKKPDGYDNLVNNVADAIQKQEQMATTITNMQQTSQLSDAEMDHMKQVQEELHQEYLKAVEELNKAVEEAKADAAALDKKTNDMQGKIDETFADVNKKVSDVHEQLDAESKGLHRDLDDTKTSLEATRKDLLNSTQEYGQVYSEVKDLQDKFNRRVWSTDLDPVREQVNKNSTEVQQTKDELKRKADQSNLDLVTNSIEDLNAKVEQNASGLEVAVKRDELGGDVSRLLGDKTNLLLGTRSFSGEDNWKNRDTVTIEPGYYKGLKSAAVQVLDGSIYQPYRVKADTAYTFSFFAREDKDNPKAKLAIKPIDAKNINIDNEEQVVHITTEWQRFAVAFSADKECDVSIQVIQGPEASNNVLHLAGLKLQYGQNNTPWEPNEADVAENIEKNESRFNVFSDQITGLVKKQEQIGDTERQLDTRITETAEGLKQTSKDLEDANGKITEFKGQLESTAKGLKTDYEKYTNEAIGQISDSSLNLIHNSAFSNQDNQFESWQNISAKATVREDSNNLHWVELTQSGQGTDNPIGVTSNHFIVKQGKVTVAVDVKLGDKANLDNQNILLLELYDESKKRVDFTDVSVSQLGLSMSVLNDHNVHRGLYRLGIDRKDVKYMTVKAILHRNGDLWLTNFSARLSSIDDGGYTPNPDDVNHQILKMNTKIEEDAEHIALKANSVDVTRDIKSAVDGIDISGVNLLRNTDPKQIDEVESDSTWILGSFGNGSAKVIDLPNSNIFTAKHGFEIYGNTNGNRDFTQRPIHWTNNKYVFSVYARIADVSFAKSVDMMTRAWSNQTNRAVFENHYTLTSKQWTRVTMSIDASSFYDQTGVSLAFGLSGYGSIDFAQPMLELANKASKWSPNPQDTSAEIKSAKDAAIQVASDQINIHVNELSTQFDDKLNKRVNEVKTASEKFTSDGIEQTVKKITEVQSNVDNLNEKVDSNNGGGINLANGTKSEDQSVGNASQTTGWQTPTIATFDNPQAGQQYTVSVNAKPNGGSWRIQIWDGTSPTQRAKWLCSESTNATQEQKHVLTFTWPSGMNKYLIVQLSNSNDGGQISWNSAKLEKGSVATPWTPAPKDIDQTIKDATEYKTVTGTVDFNNLKTQQKIFYKDAQATNAPAGGSYWYYLNVELGYDGRILQTAISDRDNITWIRTFADNWSPWIRQADQRNVDDLNNQINGFKTETTASVKNLGDRVTTEVNSITTQMNDNLANNVELVRKSDFEDGSKGGWTAQAVVPAINPAPPAELGQSGMKVLQTNTRDVFENGIWYSVKPGEKFDVDYWCAPSTSFHTNFGLAFVDKDKNTYRWQGISSDQSGQWKHYTGTITAPANAAFARPWFQMEKPADNTANTAWIAKPHIRRQNPQVAEKISELNTKWDVANGQIQGKVTETQVNDILNGKGYATQSWAESNFRMKSDSITLEVKKIIDRVNDKVDNIQVGGRNLLIGTSSEEKSGKSYNFASYQISGGLQPNTTYTLSGWARVDQTSLNHKQNVFICAYAEDWSWQARLDINGSLSSQYNKLTFTTPSGKQLHPYVTVYLSHPDGGTNQNNNDAISGTAFIKKLKLEVGNVSTDWTPAPEDIVDRVNTQVLDNANIDDMKKEGHYFVRNLTGNPIFGWVYVDVTGNGVNRIRQDVYQDDGPRHSYRRFVNDHWTDWQSEVEKTDLDNLRTETAASVKNLGDRVTTEVKSITEKINSNNGGGVNLQVGTQDCSLAISGNGNPVAIEVYDSDTKMIHSQNGGWYTNWNPSTFVPTVGETYTISCDVKGDGAINGSLFRYEGGDNGNMPDTTLTDSWQRISNTVHVNEIRGQWVIYPANSKNLYVKHLKIERGTVATPWSPAPQDAQKKIKEIDTKLDVANGQIQAKVSESQVNNILNGKGYATQEWASSQINLFKDQFNVKVEEIEALNTGGQNLLRGTADFSGTWFHKDDGWYKTDNWQDSLGHTAYKKADHAWDGLGQSVYVDAGEYTFSCQMYLELSSGQSLSFYGFDSQYNGTAKGNLYAGYYYDSSNPQRRWFTAVVHLKVTSAGILSIRPELSQDGGTVHVGSYKLERGYVDKPMWSPAPEDLVTKTRLISEINMSPEQIKVSSSKIEIDGNTYIHGELNVPNVKLKGSNGIVDLSGDGINITKDNGAGISIANNGIQLTANTNGQNEIEGVLTTAWNLDNKNQNGIGLIVTPEQDLGKPYGGDILTIGSMLPAGIVHAAMVFDATGITGGNKGFNWFAPHTLDGAGGVLRFPGAQDDLMLYAGNIPGSRQSQWNQPTMRLVNGEFQGSAGLQIQWDDIVPFGRITSSMSYMSAVGTDGNDGLTVSWYSWQGWYGGRKVPSLVSTNPDGSRRNGGFAFYPGGEVCFWQGDFRSNFRWSGLRNEN